MPAHPSIMYLSADSHASEMKCHGHPSHGHDPDIVRVRVRVSSFRVRVRVSSLVFIERNVGGRKLNILVT